MSEPKVFPFRFDARFALPLALAGITPKTASVAVGDGRLTVGFGPWRVETPLANVADARVTGPYRVYRAIGVRLSGVDLGLTFGSSAEQGVCILFGEPVTGFDPFGRLRHPGLTVTVDDCDGLRDVLVAG